MSAPSTSEQPSETSRLFDRLVFFWLAALLFLSPLVRGGNRQVALSALLALSLALVATVLAKHSVEWTRGYQLSVPAANRWWWAAALAVATSPLWLAVYQLVPLPIEHWPQLAGREAYVEALRIGSPQGTRSLSLVPMATWAAFWSGLPLAATFASALLLPHRTSERLLTVVLWAAALQVLIAFFQLVQGPTSFLFFETKFQGYRTIGSFNNRNHLADFLAMSIPVWFYLVAYRGGVSATNERPRQTSSERTRVMSGPFLMLFGCSLLVMILTTQSRGGLIAGSVALLLGTVLLIFSAKSSLSLGKILLIAAGFSIFLVVAVLSVGLDHTSARFSGDQLSSDAEVRNTFALSALDGAKNLWPWGSGIGTFDAVFPRFQSITSLGYIDYAHNDYAQLLMEIGAPAVLLALLLGLMAVWQLKMIWLSRHPAAPTIMLRCFAGVGALALLLHSWVEFNMHIPALAITAAFLLGTFLRPIFPDEA